MKTVLFHFSGTGNTLAAARGLASLIKDTTLVSVRSLVKKQAALATGHSVAGIS